MPQRTLKRILRPATAAERKRHAQIRNKAMRQLPPVRRRPPASPPGLPTQIRLAREAQGLTWYAVARRAGIPNSNTVRDIEYGRDAQISNLLAVARALGLRVELVEAGA